MKADDVKRRVCAVLAGVLVMGVLVTGTADAAPAGRDDVAFLADVRRAVAEAPLTSMPPMERLNSERDECNGPLVTDARGDGEFDIVSARVKWDCVGGMDYRLAFDGRVAEFDRVLVTVELDLDHSVRTGCGGTDRLFAISLFANGFSSRGAYVIPSCKRSTWRELPNRTMNYSFSGQTLVISPAYGTGIPQAAFRWIAGTYPEGKTAGSDRIPTGGWVPGELPPRPVPGVRLEARGTSVIVRWNPADGRGTPIRRYVVIAEREWGHAGGTRRSRRPGSAREARINGLEVGMTYTISVYAMNDQGWTGPSPYEEPVRYSPFTAPLPPTDLVVSPRLGVDGRYDLTWNYPPNNSGRILRSVILTVTPTGGEPVTSEHPVNPRRIELPELVPGTTYTIAMQATHIDATSRVTSIQFTPPDPPLGG